WSCGDEFLLRHIPHAYPEAALDVLRSLQHQLNECDDILKAVIQDVDALVTDALATYGRGRFITRCDREQCCRGFCIYVQE
ncbi:MAG TPA: hypothetical protein VHS06_06785, partial [Chloroflexota bacterium]|nr:hypothetical protein [Chloroflexota bacterium]